MSEPCTKCGGTDHHEREVRASGDSVDLMPIGFFKSGHLAMRVCGTCGFVEFRVPARHLVKVREKFPKIP